MRMQVPNKRLLLAVGDVLRHFERHHPIGTRELQPLHCQVEVADEAATHLFDVTCTSGGLGGVGR